MGDGIGANEFPRLPCGCRKAALVRLYANVHRVRRGISLHDGGLEIYLITAATFVRVPANGQLQFVAIYGWPGRSLIPIGRACGHRSPCLCACRSSVRNALALRNLVKSASVCLPLCLSGVGIGMKHVGLLQSDSARPQHGNGLYLRVRCAGDTRLGRRLRADTMCSHEKARWASCVNHNINKRIG